MEATNYNTTFALKCKTLQSAKNSVNIHLTKVKAKTAKRNTTNIYNIAVKI